MAFSILVLKLSFFKIVVLAGQWDTAIPEHLEFTRSNTVKITEHTG